MRFLYAEVVVQIDAPGLHQPFTYSIPLGETLEVGDAVVVPFGAQQVIGYVVKIRPDCPPEVTGKVKPIRNRIENAAAFDQELFNLATWVSEQTFCDLRDAVRLIAPEVMTSQIKSTIRLTEDWEERMALTRSGAQKEIVMAISALGGSAEPAKLARAVGAAKIGPTVADLRKKGVVTEERTVSLPASRRKVVRVLRLTVDSEVAMLEAARMERVGAARQARLLRALIEGEDKADASMPTSGLAVGSSAGAAARALAEKGLASYAEVPVRRDPFRFFGFVATEAPPLTDAQALAALEIGRHLTAQDGRTILLYGVTGSGKTEVYLDAVAQTVALGHGALVLLPEIGLTAQVLDLFKARFGEGDVAVLHSALSLGERHDEWRRIKSGEARVVVGARSAVFAPVMRLGLIVIDEEHDGSYKQDSVPRYHARDVAQQRAAQSGAVVLLGSATPSLESYYQTQTGEYDIVRLTERIASRPLPPVRIIDLRIEFAPKLRPKRRLASEEPAPEQPLSIFSADLLTAMTARLKRHEQAILFLNRRGFASFLLCRDCGFTFRCPNCDVSLTYHHAQRLLQCHHCDHRRRAPDTCPTCGGLRLRPFGLGTERVEEAVMRHFPQARTLRMDRDTMTRKGAHAETLRAFKRGEADILIGTQMVAKGLDFPNVTLVGVVSADTALNIPDFRSGERAFQLLTQVAGRAGRGKTPGEVIVQTFTPEHPSVQRAAEHDYLGFYEEAIAQRQELSYPPFAHLANLVYTDEEERYAQERSHRLASLLGIVINDLQTEAQVLGPVACPLARLRGRYRWHLVLRCAGKTDLLHLLRCTLSQMTMTERSGLSLDIAPLTML